MKLTDEWTPDRLEACAVFIEMVVRVMSGEGRSSKHYDPMTILMNSDGSGKALSYAMNLDNGGRSHPFLSLDDLCRQMVDECVRRIQEEVAYED